MTRSGKLVLAGVLGVMAALGTTADTLGAGNVSLGKPLVKSNGTAVLPAYFAVPGQATLWDAQTLRPCGGPPRIKKVEVAVTQAGTIRFDVRPEASIKPSLRQGMTVRVPVAVQFQPDGVNVNAPEVHVRRISLHVDRPATGARAPASTPLCGPTAPYPQP